MPLYEYRCTQCGHRFEKIQSFSSEPESECPKCHGKLDRPLNAPAFQFKGAGWYVNDYAGKASSGASGGSGTSDTASAAETKPATESKPATTAKPSVTPSTSTASA